MDTIGQYITDVLAKFKIPFDSDLRSEYHMFNEETAIYDKAIIRLYNENMCLIDELESAQEKLNINDEFAVKYSALKIKYDTLKKDNELLKSKWYVKLSNRLQNISLPTISIKW